jgi:hypothetical protein
LREQIFEGLRDRSDLIRAYAWPGSAAILRIVAICSG